VQIQASPKYAILNSE